MPEFVASNGVVLARNENDLLQMSATETDFLWPAHEVALREYFSQEPKPWESAKPGEVWVFSVGGKPAAPYTIWENGRGELVACQGNDFGIPMRDASITTGRRIWPEAGDES